MMKTIYFLLSIVCITSFLNCGKRRDPESLYYFPNADTTFVGVINGRGDTIIPAVHPALNSSDIDAFFDFYTPAKQKPRVFYRTDAKLIPDARYDFETPITGLIIQFAGISKDADADMEKPRIPAGEVYDRKGRFLYYVAGDLSNENTKGYSFITPQNFAEGYRHYVENGKLGFVDGIGNKITPAGWEYAEDFNFGYAKVYHGKWEQIPLPGYSDYRAISDTAYHYINVKGLAAKPILIAKSAKDYYIFNGEYLPNPFVYTEAEQQIVDSLNSIRALAYTNLVDIYRTESEKENLSFEITDRPKDGFPYYFVQGYWKHSGDNEYTFLVHQHTKEIFHYSPPFFLSDEKVPFARWLADGIRKVKDRIKEEMPDAKLKVDIGQELKYWQTISEQN